MSARPVDAYLGEVISPHPVTSQGNDPARPSAQLSSASLMRTGVDPQAQAFSFGGSSGELEEGESSTFPPWKAGPARTVNQLDADTVGYGSTGGGSLGNATTASHNPFLALVIGGSALLILLVVLISLLLWARSNRHPVATNKPPKDEEEGLLNSAQKGEAHELEPICTVKLRQGPKAKRPTSKNKRNHDEEETPMLDDEQGIAVSPFRRERIEVNRLSTFRSFLLIDDDSDDDTTISSPILRGLRGLASLSPQTASPEHLHKDSEQLEWDPQIDNTSPGSNLSSPDQHSLPVPLGSGVTHPVVRAALQMSNPLPALDTPPSQRGSSPREVWTESQILAAMDDEEGEPTWDPIGDSRAQMYDEMIGNAGGARNNLNNTELDEKQHFHPASENLNQNVPLEKDVSTRNGHPAALRPTGTGRSRGLVGEEGNTGGTRLPGAVSPALDESNDDVYSDAEDVLLDCELNTRLFDSDADSGDETGQLLSGTNSTLTSDDEEGDQPDHGFCHMDQLEYDNIPVGDSITIDYRPTGLESIEEEEEEDLANSHNTLKGPAGGKKIHGDQELAGVHYTSVHSSQNDLDCTEGTQTSIHDRTHTTR